MTRRRENNILTLWQIPLRGFHADQSEWIASRTAASLPYWIALAAGLGIFLELATLRWHASLLPLVGFYKNTSLISAFLGMGIGFAVGKRSPVSVAHTLLFLCLQLCFFLLVQATGWGVESLDGWSGWWNILGFLSVVYLLNTMTFVPLGQLLAGLMARVPNLKSYGVHLLGALAGLGVFAVLSYSWMPPGIWFACALAGLFVILGSAGALSRAVVVCAIFFVVFCAWEIRPLAKDIYSPYQVLTVRPSNDDARVVVSANHLFHQNILDLSRSETLRSPSAQLNAMRYDMPYQLLPGLRDVLVVGAGAGNDVAAALRRGVATVDVVEVDPALWRIGADLHPEKPYQDPRVQGHTTDARQFLQETQHKYGLIVYGQSESHTALLGLSNICLDSFIYTVEAFQQARAKLGEKGLLALSFGRIHPDLGRKLYRMLEKAFDGEAPIVLQPGYDGGVLFLAGPGVRQVATGTLPLPNLAPRYATMKGTTPLSTDDRPFFFTISSLYPGSYAGIMGALALLSLLLVRMRVPSERRAGAAASSWFFFFLGAAFILVETRAVTALALSFGGTWQLLAATAAGVITLAWVANFIAGHFPRLPVGVAFAGVGGSLVIAWWIQGPSGVKELAPGWSAAICLAPLFFSALLFSRRLREEASVASAVSAGFFGAVCSGLLEFHSMVFGFRALYVAALGMYAMAAAVYFWKQRARPVAHQSGKFALRKVASSR